MSFNSYSFLLIFLPIALLGCYLTNRIKGSRWCMIWLVGVSLFFYGLWSWVLIVLIIGSVLMNYFFGIFINRNRVNEKKLKKVLCLGVVCNLGLLIIFKYFSVYKNLNLQAFESTLESNLIIPVAVSFFTFQQIIYLVEISRGNLNETNFLNYFLYVTFFPQLINGPIIRPKEFFPQLPEKKNLPEIKVDRLAAGLTMISCGLFKKVVLADGIARYSDSAFDAVAQGAVLNIVEAWSGVMSFTLQIYFDLSGYSDIAIGIACLFGFRFPFNFESPYKASSLIEFWHRWHMTMSRFFRDYLYIPLGGNRNGFLKRAGNILIIMLIGGIWHGTGATFIIWGSLHGGLLVINHFWRQLRNSLGYSIQRKNFIYKISGCVITFITVAVLWVLFRAHSLDVAISIFQSLFGFHTSPGAAFNNIKISEDRLWFLILIVWFAPNMKEIMSKYFESENFGEVRHDFMLRRRWYHWYPNTWWAAFTTVLFVISVLELTQSRQFIYTQF
jgi:alginate O-acetyltransferase complex protein AlgI